HRRAAALRARPRRRGARGARGLPRALPVGPLPGGGGGEAARAGRREDPVRPMIRAAPVAAAIALLGCDAQVTEVLPGQPYCPTKIDVFGGAGAMLPGCGGPVDAPEPLEKGLDSTQPLWPATLAGRLQ